MSTTTFPFGLAGVNDQPTTNAADSHIYEIQSIMDENCMNNSGNVLAIVTFPSGNVANRSCVLRPWTDLQLRMNHEKLMSLGSSKIRDMFSPRCQERFRRRHNMQQNLPPGIDYILDFTPPTEGSELADLTAALWLPRMVKLWFLAGHYQPDDILKDGPGVSIFARRPLAEKAVGAILAMGHDDACKSLDCLTDLTSWQVGDVPGIVDEDPAQGLNHIPEFRKVDDYCRIRHRVAIMRVLRAISGHSLLLNSAVRMWTVAQVAIYLEVPQVVVDPVTQWLMAPPNTKFIEICPEKAFQLALALKIPSVLQAAFRILVSEFAVDYAASTPSPRRAPVTWAQRKRDDYGDFPSDPVDYASRAFVERMLGVLEALRSDDVFTKLFTKQKGQWKKLQYLGGLLRNADLNYAAAYYKLRAALLGLFRLMIDQAFTDIGAQETQKLSFIEAQRKHYIPDKERKPIIELYNRLEPKQRLMTPFFWEKLRSAATDENAYGMQSWEGRRLNLLVGDFNRVVEDALKYEEISIDMESFCQNYHKGWHVGFELTYFHEEMCAAVRDLCGQFISTTKGRVDSSNDSCIPFFLSDHLILNLDEGELNFLPIWADGLDDGSGGVFQEVIPPTDMGPSEPGPAYHTGWTAKTDTEGGRGTQGGDTDTLDGYHSYAPTMVSMTDSVDGLGMEGLEIMSGTAARSLDAQQSTTTEGYGGKGDHKGKGKGKEKVVVVAMTEGMSETDVSEAFTPSDDDVEFYDAMYHHPAGHQAQGRAIEDYVLGSVESSVSGAGETPAGTTTTGPPETDDSDFMLLEGDENDTDDSDDTIGDIDDDDNFFLSDDGNSNRGGG
ncbi:hypothetical protein QBC46DRAFT_253231 [Diplogelasinospora grovesii]|uniref:Uncharacterized protein n=1 Tax=Diplogelasinospora grovesii TaxID=303347 RepID=A0AAN6NFH9_9PEZI|nr:hypothetical protein QBC46DRAFT_253231 [Diplogelasinospora grovesii]